MIKRRHNKGSVPKNELLEWAKTIVMAFVVALVLKATVVQSYVITTGSMNPTIIPHDRVFGNRFIYRFADPKQGDIVAFKPPEKAVQLSGSTIPFVKRVIAVEGDTVSIHNGIVFVNGKKLSDPYVINHSNDDFPTTLVPPGNVFVMGDNRPNSLDSRMWDFLPKRNILAKAVFRFWPIQRAGVVR